MLRYQSNVIEGLAGGAGILVTLSQKPLRARPVSTQAGSWILRRPASTQAYPTYSRMASQTRASRVSLKRSFGRWAGPR